MLPLRWKRRETGLEAKQVLARERAIFARAGFGAALARDSHRLLGAYIVGMIVTWEQARGSVPEHAWLTQLDAGLGIVLDGIAARHRRDK